MEKMKIGENVYEVLECGNLLGNISHVRSYWDVLAEVVHSGKDSGDNFYAVVKYLDDGGVEMFWEKELHDQGVLPLKLIDEDCVEEAFFPVKVVGLQKYDDHDLVEFMVPQGMGEHLLIIEEFDFSLEWE